MGDIRKTEQEILNESYDWLLSLLGVSLWGYDDTPGATGARRLAVNPSGQLETSIAGDTSDPFSGYGLYAFLDDGVIMYIMEQNASGAWIITKVIQATGVTTYAKGSSDAATNWANRASLIYSDYNSTF